MNLKVPPELEAKLARLAAETGRTPDQVALDLLASSVDHDEWFRAEKGRAAAPEGRLIEHDDAAGVETVACGPVLIVVHCRIRRVSPRP